MMVKLIGLLLLLVLGVVGCSSSSSPEPIEAYAPLPVTSAELDPITEQRLIDSPWISPAVVEISNIYPGARAEWNLRVHNGGEEESRFVVAYREPGNRREGYEVPPRRAQYWVLIADPTPVLAPKETREILVVLEIPAGAIVAPESKWEFWISVIEDTDAMIQTELTSRWLVSMR